LIGAPTGTQRVSPSRRVIPSITFLAVLATLVVGANGVTIALGATAAPPALAASPSGAASGPVLADSLGATVVADSTASASTASTSSASTTTSTSWYSETSSKVVYHGSWSSATYSGYYGSRIRWSRQRGATAVFSFTGTAVSWIGPVGPTRGQAKVYVDGRYIRTVSMYARSFVARHTIYAASFSTQRARTLKILVVGTAGHPTVGIDAFVVRRLTTGAAPPSSGVVVNVSSIPALKSALANNAVDQIVVANGTYHVSPSSTNASDSLWIGPQYASRTRPVLVRAATLGQVTFDGGGATGYRALAFEAGVHDQTWDGFNFANMGAQQSGIIEIAGYTSRAAPHHITLRHMTILASCTGRATTANGSVWDHAIYVSQALAPGAHDLLFEDIVVHGEGNLATAFHFFHGADFGAYNAHDVVIRRLTVTGTQQAFLIWEPTVYNITLDTARISNARAYAIRFETIGSRIPTGILIANVTSTGSGYQGFYSTLGSHPPGVTFTNDSLH
jgi:hypothetical protein